MTLVRTDTLQPWRGEPLSGGIKHPANIEQLWSAAELDAIGLAKALPPIIPEGKQPADNPVLRYEKVGDVIHEAFDLMDIPVPPPEPADSLGAIRNDLNALDARLVAMESK
jgi:hypothetical protein